MPTDAALRDPRVSNRRFLEQQMRKHGDGGLVEIMQDTISKDAGLSGTLEWTSPDLQIIYSASAPRRNSLPKRRPDTNKLPTMTVTRERCAPILENPN